MANSPFDSFRAIYIYSPVNRLHPQFIPDILDHGFIADRRQIHFQRNIFLSIGSLQALFIQLPAIVFVDHLDILPYQAFRNGKKPFDQIRFSDSFQIFINDQDLFRQRSQRRPQAFKSRRPARIAAPEEVI